MTNTIADIEEADVILITGSNTTENHPVLSSVVKRAVTAKGTKLIVVDPRRIRITRYATKWLRQNLGSDVAWINGLMHVIIKEGLQAKKFIESRTEGFDELQRIVEKFTPEVVERITGIPAQEIIDAARLYAQAERGAILYCMGITQHTTGTDNVKSLANLAMLCGNMGIAGGGVNPLRGQNNVQGACDLGGLPDVYSGYQKVTDPDVRQRMCEAWKVDTLSEQPGMKATQMIPAAHDGTLKALYVIGENPLVSDPDLNHAEESLKHLDFLVVQDIFLTETAQLADVVLPSKCFAEKEGTFSNTERRVQRVRKEVDAPGEWMLDRTEGVLYLSPPAGEGGAGLAGREVVISMLAGTVSLWHSWKETEIPGLNNVIAAFQEKHPDVQFDVLYVPHEDLQGKYETAAATGGGPSVLIGSADWGPGWYDAELAADVSAMTTEEFLRTINPAALGAVRYRDALIGLPQTIKGVVMFRNTSIIPDAPATFDDLLTAAQAATTGDVVGALLIVK